MLIISSASWAIKLSLISLSFHEPSFLNSELTLLPFKASGGAKTVRQPFLLIQGSSAITMCLPSPTLHLYPLMKRSLPHKMLLQTREGLLPRGAFRKTLPLKYLPLKTFTRRLPGFLIIFQLCLGSMTWLNKLISLKPMPPTSLLLLS